MGRNLFLHKGLNLDLNPSGRNVPSLEETTLEQGCLDSLWHWCIVSQTSISPYRIIRYCQHRIAIPLQYDQIFSIYACNYVRCSKPFSKLAIYLPQRNCQLAIGGTHAFISVICKALNLDSVLSLISQLLDGECSKDQVLYRTYETELP